MDRPSVLALQKRIEKARREVVRLQRRAAQLEVDVAAAHGVDLRGDRGKARTTRKIPSKVTIQVRRETKPSQVLNATHGPPADKQSVPKAKRKPTPAKVPTPKAARVSRVPIVAQLTTAAAEASPTQRPSDPDEAALLLVVQEAWPSSVSIADLSVRLHLTQERCKSVAERLIGGRWMSVAGTSGNGYGETAFVADL